MTNYGSDVKFEESREGNGYKWIASCDFYDKETTFIRKHPMWLEYEEDRVISRLVHCLSHEPIHCLLWDWFGISGASLSLDVGRILFLNMLDSMGLFEEELKEIVLGL